MAWLVSSSFQVENEIVLNSLSPSLPPLPMSPPLFLSFSPTHSLFSPIKYLIFIMLQIRVPHEHIVNDLPTVRSIEERHSAAFEDEKKNNNLLTTEYLCVCKIESKLWHKVCHTDTGCVDQKSTEIALLASVMSPSAADVPTCSSVPFLCMCRTSEAVSGTFFFPLFCSYLDYTASGISMMNLTIVWS